MLGNDLVYSLRRLRRAPGVVIAVVISLGLGIAANATIFSAVSKFILAPVPVGDPATLVTIYRTYDNGACCNELPMPVYRDLREQAKSFSAIAAYYELVPVSLGGGGDPERVWGQATTADYFNVARLRMAQGRGFAANEEQAPIVVLSYDLWRRRFHGDPSIIDRTVSLNGEVFTVVGVAPKRFRGLDLILDPQFWVPLGMLPRLASTAPDPSSRQVQWLRVAARLKPGVPARQATAELLLLGQRFEHQHPETDKGDNFHLEPAGSLPPRDKKSVELFLTALLVVVMLVLLIAGANVANLLLAQGAQRQREMAVRQALGASRQDLLRQILLESSFMALGGGALGVLLSVWATNGLSLFRLPAPMPLDLAVAVDWRVLLYSLALSVGAGLLCGFVPAWTASAPVMPNALKGEDSLARPGRAWSLRNILVVIQISLSLVLLCAATLFLRSLGGATKIDPGFRQSGLLTVGVDPQNYPPAKTMQLLREVPTRVAALPGVLSVTVTDGLPLSGGHHSDAFTPEGKPLKTEAVTVEMFMAGTGYLQTMGIPLLAGRDLKRENPAGPRVAVVNQELVRQFFPGENPIGHRILDGGVAYEIVGVAGNTKSRFIGEDARPIMYRSIDQAIVSDPSGDGYRFLVRYQGDAGLLADSIRREIRRQDAGLAVFDVQTMKEHLRDALFLPRLAGTLFSVFGVVGVLLASVGLYGLVSYSVSQRRKEIGIRMAMGARSGQVQALFVLAGMWLSLVSFAVGLPIALMGARLARSLLYGVQPMDVVTFTAVPILLLAITIAASWIPARRASRVDPMVALRVD